jgi:hypothetical protein
MRSYVAPACLDHVSKVRTLIRNHTSYNCGPVIVECDYVAIKGNLSTEHLKRIFDAEARFAMILCPRAHLDDAAEDKRVSRVELVPRQLVVIF